MVNPDPPPDKHDMCNVIVCVGEGRLVDDERVPTVLYPGRTQQEAVHRRLHPTPNHLNTQHDRTGI